MKELLEYIVKNLVSNPDKVVVEEENQDGNVNLYLTVDPADMGIVIGKGGQTIHSLRKILTVRAIAENIRVNLQLTEPEGGKPQEKDTEEQNDKDAEETPVEETEDKEATPEEETPQESEEKTS